MNVIVDLDTKASVSAFESTNQCADEMLRVFDAAGSGELQGVTSEPTPAELLPKPLSLGQAISALSTPRCFQDLALSASFPDPGP